ncbi:MAG: class I SAM-dependent methyltransferase [Kineosporiaceae bacterium]
MTPAPGSHYFDPAPGPESGRRTLEYRVAGRMLRVTTAGGVFSPGRLDPGTGVLLRHAPRPPSHGDLLDLGCGWGPLALAMALFSPDATVWAVDVNPRARELTAANAADHGLARVRTAAPEEIPDDLRLAAIWSNPPIRIGKDALHALLAQWLPRLAPGASAWLVVQRNLGADSLHRWLAHTLAGTAAVERAGSAKGYRVLRVRRPPASPG